MSTHLGVFRLNDLRPDGSLDTGTPAEARDLAMTLLLLLSAILDIRHMMVVHHYPRIVIVVERDQGNACRAIKCLAGDYNNAMS